MNRLLSALLKLRARLIFWMAERGMPASQIAEGTSLSDEDVKRIIWWKRSERGEPNGGWL